MTNVITVFADVCCPFTHVGLHRLVARRTETHADFVVRVRAWPLELVNGSPFDAASIGKKVDQLRSQVAPEMFAGFDPSSFPGSSLPALGVEAAAYRHGVADGERLSLMLRDALFEHGRDISRSDVLADIVAAAGLPPAPDSAKLTEQVVEDWRDGQRRGVLGSPHFFVGGHGFFCPALRIDHDGGRLSISPDPARFDAFLAECVVG